MKKQKTRKQLKRVLDRLEKKYPALKWLLHQPCYVLSLEIDRKDNNDEQLQSERIVG